MDTIDRATVETALPQASGWLVEQHVGYDGLLTVVATNEQDDLSFAFARSGNGIQVTEVRNDVVEPRGTFPDMNTAVSAAIRTAPKT